MKNIDYSQKALIQFHSTSPLAGFPEIDNMVFSEKSGGNHKLSVFIKKYKWIASHKQEIAKIHRCQNNSFNLKKQNVTVASRRLLPLTLFMEVVFFEYCLQSFICSFFAINHISKSCFLRDMWHKNHLWYFKTVKYYLTILKTSLIVLIPKYHYKICYNYQLDLEGEWTTGQ